MENPSFSPEQTERNVSPDRARKELLQLGYFSFGDAQGDQVLQVHVLWATLQRMLERGYPVDVDELANFESKMAKRKAPRKHKTIGVDNQQEAQMSFWWRLMLLEATANNLQDPNLLPVRSELDAMVPEVGGHTEMSSFTEEEMHDLAAAFDIYRDRKPEDLDWQSVMSELWVPRLIEVETQWLYKGRLRPRGGDPYESVWLKYATIAHNHAETIPKEEMSTRDLMYLSIAEFMSDAEENEPDSKLVRDYRDMLDFYNSTHPYDEPVASLYRP